MQNGQKNYLSHAKTGSLQRGNRFEDMKLEMTYFMYVIHDISKL